VNGRPVACRWRGSYAERRGAKPLPPRAIDLVVLRPPVERDEPDTRRGRRILNALIALGAVLLLALVALGGGFVAQQLLFLGQPASSSGDDSR
jgi:hypothetical protein